MHKQDEEHFPKGHEIKETERVESKSKALHKVINIIREASDDDCQKASVLEDKIHQMIRKEKSLHAEELKRITESVIKANSDVKFESAFSELRTCLIKNKYIEESFNFAVLKAIYRFRCHLGRKVVFESGKHFNHHVLDESARLYDENYVDFGNDWNSPKNILCWQKVLGWIERLVPACDGQVIAQGTWDVLENRKKPRRSLAYSYGGGTYFPLDSNPNWELGYNCGSVRGSVRRAAERGGAPPDFQNLCRAKTQSPILCGGQTINYRRLLA